MNAIAIGFCQEPPTGLEKWQGGAVPAGCVFWREALKGRSFYTVPSDHYNCAVGAYTHSIGLPTERGSQLEETVTFMVTKLGEIGKANAEMQRRYRDHQAQFAMV